jgi:hypothetical protein
MSVWRNVGLQKIGGMELGQKIDGFILSGGVVSKSGDYR